MSLEEEREGRLAAEERAEELSARLERHGVWGWLRRLARGGRA